MLAGYGLSSGASAAPSAGHPNTLLGQQRVGSEVSTSGFHGCVRAHSLISFGAK